MRVPDQVRKTVIFLAYKDLTSGNYQPVGSAFFIGAGPVRSDGMVGRCFIVTARHVIENLLRLGVEQTYLRLNPIDPALGPQLISIPTSRWKFHADQKVDVAVIEHGVPANTDHLVLPPDIGATPEIMASNEVDLGDEVFVSGLFSYHFGQSRNIPIIRVGTLAALKEEPVLTKRGPLDAYLIEARSIGGLSGSPVFLNFGSSRTIGGRTQFAQGSPPSFLLGIIHGHFESAGQEDALEDASDPDRIRAAVNAGIAIVTPQEKVFEAIDYNFFAAARAVRQLTPLTFDRLQSELKVIPTAECYRASSTGSATPSSAAIVAPSPPAALSRAA